ncbi:MAG: dihydrofolate reductase, partial [bacterium]
GRRNIVVTRKAGWRAEGCETAASLEAALAAAGTAEDEVFVIGGAQLYAAALPLTQRLYLTEIRADFRGDARFPGFDRRAWKEVSREMRLGETGLRFDFVVYERAETDSS